MAHNKKHTYYNSIYNKIKLADRIHIESFESQADAKRFNLAVRWYTKYNGLGWIVSMNLLEVTIAKSTTNRMTVGRMISELNRWNKEALVDVSIKHEDGDTSWYAIAGVEELNKKSVKEHLLIYLGECVMS